MTINNTIENKIILIGGEQHNGIGIARSLGVKGIMPYGIITSPGERRYTSKSKFWKETWLVLDDENGIMTVLRQEFNSEKQKPIIIPYSDLAEEVIDKNLNELKQKFIVPSINGMQGAVNKLQDKNIQYKLAQDYGIPMAKSWVINISPVLSIPNDISFPCILKPQVSSEGDKRDIVICKNIDQLENAIKILESKSYKRIFAQEYINKDYELDLFGCIMMNSNEIILCPLRIIREWPVSGGTNCYSSFVIDQGIRNECIKIVEVLRYIGFRGTYDIELFNVKGKIYLNEINFRNSGNGHCSVFQEMYYPYIWCLDAAGLRIPNFKKYADKAGYVMTEVTDFRHVIYGHLGFKNWLADLHKTNCFMLFDKRDMKPFWNRILYYIKQSMHKGKEQRKKAE
ncbi:ATP-grasp domain-containing protein [Clostridium sp. FP1]|uniref:ATP-grasp domain-containing protein n=1 Tax=Clostridium sp. FP1 TaxID=2724076 RepID=UPI0013E98303|nr:ATP-grasp domain-containing protein [Clostridium sp. FP1]MBZ9636625.1 ATP-grasp domain-containing protein [Clostridium sp. FP1]